MRGGIETDRALTEATTLWFRRRGVTHYAWREGWRIRTAVERGENSLTMADRYGHSALSFIFTRHGGWIRVGRSGRGMGYMDHRKQGPLFSERYSGQNGVPKRHYLHVGPYCLRTLRRLG